MRTILSLAMIIMVANAVSCFSQESRGVASLDDTDSDRLVECQSTFPGHFFDGELIIRRLRSTGWIYGRFYSVGANQLLTPLAIDVPDPRHAFGIDKVIRSDVRHAGAFYITAPEFFLSIDFSKAPQKENLHGREELLYNAEITTTLLNPDRVKFNTTAYECAILEHSHLE